MLIKVSNVSLHPYLLHGVWRLCEFVLLEHVVNVLVPAVEHGISHGRGGIRHDTKVLL